MKQIVLDGVLAESESIRNLLIAFALRSALGHLKFPRGKLVDLAGPDAFARWGAPESFQQELRMVLVSPDLALANLLDAARKSSDKDSVPVGVADATARVHLSPSAAEALSRPVEPKYPMLAKQMRVQGAVVLEALIGRDGNIQTLHVLSGPAILPAAAREAVEQWRFKPYLQSGQTVETKARIVVNFTIFT